MTHEMDKAVRHVVEKQMAAGIDIGNDGEQQRVGFQTYVPQRMTGFAGVSKRRRGREFEEFPELVAMPDAALSACQPRAAERAGGAGRIEISRHQADRATRSRASRRSPTSRRSAERFMTAPSPGIISSTMLNAYYDSHDAYLDAIAREMKNEYQAIHKAGLILQIDAPDLAMDRTMMYRDLDRRAVRQALSSGTSRRSTRASTGIPRDRVRLHVCYGNWEGPHIHDVPLGNNSAGALSRPMSARCRSSSPIRATRTNTLRSRSIRCRKHMLLIPGVVETTSNFRRASRRWWRVASRRRCAAVGDRERVIASTDCGFGTFTNREWVIEPAVWLKLAAIRAGRRYRLGEALGQEGRLNRDGDMRSLWLLQNPFWFSDRQRLIDGLRELMSQRG